MQGHQIMDYQSLSIQDKKRLLKENAFRFYFHVINSAIFWMIIGFVVSTLMMNSVLITTFNQIDKLMVCK